MVIGNPPYIQLSQTNLILLGYKTYLIEKYKTSGGRLNTFIFFTHIAGWLLKRKGLLSYIIPNTILTQESYNYTRKYLVNDVTLTEIVGFPILPFEDAVVETVIIQFQNSIKENYKIKLSELSPNNYKVISENDVSQVKSDQNAFLSFNVDSIVNKVFSKENILFDKICTINQAIALKGDKSLSLNNENPEGAFYKLLDGRNINRYLINWDGVYLDYELDRIHSCKRQDIFETQEKLFFRRVSASLIFAYDDSQYYALNTLIVVNLKEGESRYNLKLLLALMNSKLMDYVYRNKFKSTKTVFSEIQARSIGQLPVPVLTKEYQNMFVELVNQILSLKKSNPTADTSALEKEIDQMVYELYGLTDEEIWIVE